MNAVDHNNVVIFDDKDTYIFPAGVVLTLPEIELTVSESLPPWKQGVTVSE